MHTGLRRKQCSEQKRCGSEKLRLLELHWVQIHHYLYRVQICRLGVVRCVSVRYSLAGLSLCHCNADNVMDGVPYKHSVTHVVHCHAKVLRLLAGSVDCASAICALCPTANLQPRCVTCSGTFMSTAWPHQPSCVTCCTDTTAKLCCLCHSVRFCHGQSVVTRAQGHVLGAIRLQCTPTYLHGCLLYVSPCGAWTAIVLLALETIAATQSSTCWCCIQNVSSPAGTAGAAAVGPIVYQTVCES